MALSIRHKLIIAFSSVALFVTLVAFFSMLFTFRAGFLQYLNDIRYDLTLKLSSSIAEEINSKEDWLLLVSDSRRWNSLITQTLRLDHSHLSIKEKQNEAISEKQEAISEKQNEVQLVEDKNTFGSNKGSKSKVEQFGQDIGMPRIDKKQHERGDRRLFRKHISRAYVLLDKDKKIIFGKPSPAGELRLAEIKNNNYIYGYVGILSLTNIDNTADKIFVYKQTRSFIYIALMACLLAVVVAYFISKKMSSPIQRLVYSVDRLMLKDYKVSVDYKSNDEIGSLVQSFNRLGASLAEHERSQQQWIADISHELRTPISTLRGELEAMLDGIRNINIERIHSLHEDILRLQRLVEDLHQLSLSDAGAFQYRFETVGIHSIIESLFDLRQNDIEMHQLRSTLNLKIPNSETMVFADSGRLHQLFENLLQNSLRYTDANGCIEVTTAKEISSVDNSAWVVVRWEDSSPAVGDGSIEKLFDRLYRDEKSRSRAEAGSGLGLSICKAIVEGHGATIQAEKSNLGGLKLTLKFPMSKIKKL